MKFLLFSSLLLIVGAGCQTEKPLPENVKSSSPAPVVDVRPVAKPTNAPSIVLTKEISLFDGKTLSGWAITGFGGHGEVSVENGEIQINMGADLSGITWTNGGLPKINYEIELDAMKVDGSDFFCGLTFPVRESYCSLILGGWGGGTVGLSSLDGMDASENDTSRSLYFEKKRWFHIRLRVLEEKIETWIDDKKIIDVEIKGRKIALRAGDIDRCIPLGFSTYQTTAALKNIKLRSVGN